MFLLKVIAIDEKIDDETESILSPTDTLDDFKKYNVLYPNPLYKINRGSPEAKIEIYIYRFPSDRHKDLYFEYSQKEINNQYYLLKEHLDFLAKYSHHFLRYPKVKLFLKSNVLSRNMGEYHPSRRHFSSKAVILNNTFYNLELSSIHLRTELFKTLIHEFGHKESFEIKNQKNFIQLLNIKTKLKNNSSSAQDKKLTEIIHEFVEHFARFEELIWGFTYTKEISSETVRKLRKAIRMLDLLSTVQNPNETLILINKIWKKLRPIYSFRTTVIP